MTSDARSPDEYISKLPDGRREPMKMLRKIIRENLPLGFQETMSYGMIGFVVPLSTYPAGYHCTPDTPLPFINIASQKNHIALYHSGIYSCDELHDWFVSEYPRHVKTKLDMGKSCIRFKNSKNIPYDLIAELAQKIDLKTWIKIYEDGIQK
ncbi:MAG: DUF1801 domain-containing protein [Akkermansiaceae bacterium]